MPVLWAVCKLYKAKMVVDWHNYGYTILGLRLDKESVILRIAEKIERAFGRLETGKVEWDRGIVIGREGITSEIY